MFSMLSPSTHKHIAPNQFFPMSGRNNWIVFVVDVGHDASTHPVEIAVEAVVSQDNRTLDKKPHFLVADSHIHYRYLP